MTVVKVKHTSRGLHVIVNGRTVYHYLVYNYSWKDTGEKVQCLHSIVSEGSYDLDRLTDVLADFKMTYYKDYTNEYVERLKRRL